MEKIKKLFITSFIFLLTICNFNCVFADDIENNDDDIINENIVNDNPIIIENNINLEQLNNIENNINNINDNINNIMPLLNAVNPTYGGVMCVHLLSYDHLSSLQLEWLYSHFNYDDLILYEDNSYIWHSYPNKTPYYSEDDLYWYIDETKRNGFGLNGQIYNGNYSITLNNAYYGSVKYYIIKNNVVKDKFKYELQPFKLNVINNGLGTITNSVNYEPYSSTNIYYNNQSITLSYDNSNDDFLGWYKNGEFVSNNLSYTFNINTDTTIEINKYIEPIDHDIYSMSIMCIFICLLFITFKSLIWGV